MSELLNVTPVNCGNGQQQLRARDGRVADVRARRPCCTSDSAHSDSAPRPATRYCGSSWLMLRPSCSRCDAARADVARREHDAAREAGAGCRTRTAARIRRSASPRSYTVIDWPMPVKPPPVLPDRLQQSVRIRIVERCRGREVVVDRRDDRSRLRVAERALERERQRRPEDTVAAADRRLRHWPSRRSRSAARA